MLTVLVGVHEESGDLLVEVVSQANEGRVERLRVAPEQVFLVSYGEHSFRQCDCEMNLMIM